LGVKDAGGDVERLRINTVCIMLHKDHQWPQSGHWFVIKEPLLTFEARKFGAEGVASRLLNFAKTLERVNHGTETQTLQACQQRLSQLFGTPEDVVVERMAEMAL
jgi:hypothetical protein